MIELKALTPADIVAHNLGEDAETVRWLTGEYGTEESTRQHFERLANNASSGLGARGFGIWADERLAGYIECDPDLADLPAKGDVNVSYSIHPWARRRGIATAAVEIICEIIVAEEIGSRAIARIEEGNTASIGVVSRLGFEFMGTYRSTIDQHLDGKPMVYQVYSLDLHRRI
ncbi:GNAT family N-acetyltransferase [Brevibacterium sediminis]|nr:GNAT family N-acetyltransferase [Brevibacterium sediminis]